MRYDDVSESANDVSSEDGSLDGDYDSVDGELAFTFAVKEFRALSPTKHAKVYSDAHEMNDALWRLLIFPFGSSQENVRKVEANDALSVSVFLECGPKSAREASGQWKRHAKFALRLVHPTNPNDEAYMEQKDTSHSFHNEEADWGFTTFISRLKLFQGGYVDENGAVTFGVRVRPCDEFEIEKPGVRNVYNNEYDSRKETGFIGLKNQGATCYMNSLLQTLYHIPSFRQAVYHMPTNEADEAHNTMPLALQSVFYRLQYAKEGAVSTKDLTRSFGWDSYDSFMQHDVQELNRVLQDKLEETMKQTTVEGTIQKLFEGHTTNFIECINVDYKSERKEEFLDLQLDVKGCKDIYASFDRYTEIEKLDGDNKYRAEGHGLQDARKGVLFHDFPPVLQIQLKRFEYDFHRDTMVKIHDRYEFPEELDLDVGDRKYLVPEADKSVRNKYRLHSVLVHSGGINGGHYYAFIKPDLKDADDAQWYKFDDEHVTKQSAEQAVMDQYGSRGTAANVDSDMDADDDSSNMRIAPNLRFTKVSSAYMLVYIRESDMDQILCDATKEHLAEHLRARFAKEQEDKERRRLEKAEAHLYTVMKVLEKNGIEEQIGKKVFFDLGDFEDAHRFRLPKKTPFAEFRAIAAKSLGVPIERQRWWTFAPRRNTTYRPHAMVPESCDTLPVEHCRQKMHTSGSAPNELKFYLEDLGNKEPDVNRDEVCLFLKYYNPDRAELRFVGNFYASMHDKLTKYLPVMREMCGFDQDTPVDVYEEISFMGTDGEVDVPKYDETTMANSAIGANVEGANLQLSHGDILVLQKRNTEAPQSQFPTATIFYSHKHNHQVMIFRELSAPKVDKVSLDLNKMMSYDQVAEELAAAINLDDATMLRFTPHNAYTNGPRANSIRFRGCDTLTQMIEPQQSNVLYYEILDIPLPKLETLKSLKVSFHGSNTKLIEEFNIRLPKGSPVKSVLNDIQNRLGDRVKGSKLRLLELFYSQIYKVFDEDQDISDINDQYWTLRAEEVPEDEIEETLDGNYLRIYNISKDLSNPNTYHCYDEPFLLRISSSETLGELKSRIQKKLEASDQDFAKWKFFIGASSKYDLLEDDNFVLCSKFIRVDKQGFFENILGVEREIKGPRRPASRQGKGSFERAIKIM